jgi:hypothetical protein
VIPEGTTFDINIADLALRTGLDIAAVAVGIFIGETVSRKG